MPPFPYSVIAIVVAVASSLADLSLFNICIGSKINNPIYNYTKVLSGPKSQTVKFAKRVISEVTVKFPEI